MPPKKVEPPSTADAEEKIEDAPPPKVALPLSVTANTPETLILLLKAGEAEVQMAALTSLQTYVDRAFEPDPVEPVVVEDPKEKKKKAKEGDDDKKKKKGKDEPVVEDTEPSKEERQAMIFNLGGISVLMTMLVEAGIEFKTIVLEVLIVLTQHAESRQQIVRLDGVPPLLEFMAGSDSTLEELSTKLLAACAVDTITQEALAELGAFELFMQQLKSPALPVTLLPYVVLIVAHSTEIEIVRDTVFKLDYFPILIELLKHESQDVQLYSATALSHCVMLDEHQRELRRLKGVAPVVELLRSNNEDIQAVAAVIICLIAYDYDSRLEISTLEGFRALVKLVSSTNIAVQQSALLAVHKCALDVPFRVTFVHLRCIPPVTALLSSEQLRTQINAALVIGQLVHDTNSAREFKESAGIEAILPLISSEDEELQHAALNALQLCSTQGELREEIHTKGGLQTLHTIAGGEQPKLAVLATAALSQIAYNEQAREAMSQLDIVALFLTHIKGDNPGLQLPSLQALAVFAHDEAGRALIRDQEGVRVLVNSLNSPSFEVRRATVMALVTVMRDVASAEEICNIGGLEALLEMAKTHQKQMGRLLNDTIFRLMRANLTAKWLYKGELDATDKTRNGFYDMGLHPPFRPLADLRTQPVDTALPVLVADLSLDARLDKCLQDAKTKVGQAKTLPEKLRVLAVMVSDRLGGSRPYETYNDFGYVFDVNRCKLLRNTNCVWIGDLCKGICPHRAFLFKFLADQVGLDVSLERGKHRSGAHAAHSWNMVEVDGTPHVVDLMHNVGDICALGTEACKRYRREDGFAFSTL